MNKRDIFLACLMAAFIICPPEIFADEPVPAAPEIVYSPNKTCLARPSENKADTVIVRLSGIAEEPLWTMPHRSHPLYVADDCHSVAELYKGQNLLAIDDNKAETVVVTFFKDGENVRQVTLGELYKNMSVLPLGSSHWVWHDGIIWTGQSLEIKTVDGRIIVFEM